MDFFVSLAQYEGSFHILFDVRFFLVTISPLIPVYFHTPVGLVCFMYIKIHSFGAVSSIGHRVTTKELR